MAVGEPETKDLVESEREADSVPVCGRFDTGTEIAVKTSRLHVEDIQNLRKEIAGCRFER